MNDDERAATERQRLVLVHDAQSPVRNLAAEEGLSRSNGDDAPIDLADLEAARFPAQPPVTACTDGHRTAAYSTGAVLVPRQVTVPAPDSSIVVEPTVLDGSPQGADPARLAPTVRTVRDPKHDAETVPDGHKLLAQRRSLWVVTVGGTIGLLVAVVVMNSIGRGDEQHLRREGAQSAITTYSPSPAAPPAPPNSNAALDSEEPGATAPVPSSGPVGPTPRYVAGSRTTGDAPARQRPASAATADDTPRSRLTKRTFIEKPGQ